MPEAIAAFVADAYAFNVAGATVGTAAAIEAVVAAAASAALGSVVSKALAPSQSSGRGGTVSSQALNTVVRQSAAARRLIYGQVKAGGVLSYPAQNVAGTKAWLVTYIGEGPIESVDPVFWIGDELSSDAKFSGLTGLEVFTGAPGQVASAALVSNSGGEWASTAVGNGIAYAITEYTFDRTAFPRGLVFPAFLVQGRKLYDPRTLASAYSANPALALLDFVRSPFGYGAADSWIDFDSFAAAANICDEIITSIDPANIVAGVPNRVRRYTINGVFEVSAGPAQIVETIEKAMAGKLIFSEGKYRCYAGAYRAPSGPVLTGEYLRAAPKMRTHPTRQQRINIARGTYREPLQDWQTTDFHEQRLAAAVIAEDGEIIQTMDFPVTTQGAIAQRLARIAMRQSRSAVPLVLNCNWAAFQYQLWDVITVTIPELGIDAQPYLIAEYKFAEGGGIDLVCVPHLASDYAWDSATDEVLVVPVTKPNFNALPPAIAGLVVTGTPIIQEGFAQPVLTATWTATTDARLAHYEAQYRINGGSEWLGGQTVTTPQAQWFLQQDEAYDVRVRVVRRSGAVGPWVEDLNTTVNGDTTPPDVPTALSVTGTGTHTINWTNPTNNDVLRARVFINTVNDAPSATALSGDVYGLPATAYSKVHTPAGTPRYYYVSVIDRSGNASAREYAGMGS